MIQTLSLVALGGALGSAARYLVGVAVMRTVGPGFPFATLGVNVAGSFLMGVLVVALATSGSLRAAPFLMTGVLGGFTTFSAFSLDAVALWQRGALSAAALYVAGSVGLSLLALCAGMWAARALGGGAA